MERPDVDWLSWPFFSDEHRRFAEDLWTWCAAATWDSDPTEDVDAACRERVRRLGQAGWLQVTARTPGSDERLDVRTLCIARETLSFFDGLADFAFAMQGLGAGALTLFGTPAQTEWLDKTRAGVAIPAFALSEPRSGSDVARLACSARPAGGSAGSKEGWILDGEKTWISNGGIADFYLLFARTSDDDARGISAFLVPADTPGLHVAERLEVMAPHPLARLRLDDVRLGPEALVGDVGQGFKIAMSVLDVFRSTVGAAALGFARRALSASLSRSRERHLFGAPMSELQMVQAYLAEMALDVDAATLLIYRAAWCKDQGKERVTREAAMAKLFATERAQSVIDKAVQLHGGDGVRRGHPVEALYREIRALRIYEGASEVQKVVIARESLKRHPATQTSDAASFEPEPRRGA
ncbi:MAG: acyl-CoA dehydrogenase family protein [Myxococcota bacterium]